MERLIVATSVSTMSTYELDGLELEAKQNCKRTLLNQCQKGINLLLLCEKGGQCVASAVLSLIERNSDCSSEDSIVHS